VSDEKIYDAFWRDAPKWVESAVRSNWPQESSFRVRGMKEYHLGFYSVAVDHKEGGFGAARILSGDELRRDPKPLVEMWARELEHELRQFRG
jgi:hypothetical protein